MSQRSTALALRRAFEARFAEAPANGAGERLRLVVVTVEGAPIALPVVGLAGIARIPRLVRLPGGAPGLLGLAGVRGRVVPVFDLGELVGARAASRARAWAALVEEPARVGLGFDAVEGYVEASRADVADTPAAREGDGRHVTALVRRGPALVPVVNLASAMDALRHRGAPHLGARPLGEGGAA